MRDLARRIHSQTAWLARRLRELGHEVVNGSFFDTLTVVPKGEVESGDFNLRRFEDGRLGNHIN